MATNQLVNVVDLGESGQCKYWLGSLMEQLSSSSTFCYGPTNYRITASQRSTVIASDYSNPQQLFSGLFKSITFQQLGCCAVPNLSTYRTTTIVNFQGNFNSARTLFQAVAQLPNVTTVNIVIFAGQRNYAGEHSSNAKVPVCAQVKILGLRIDEAYYKSVLPLFCHAGKSQSDCVGDRCCLSAIQQALLILAETILLLGRNAFPNSHLQAYLPYTGKFNAALQAFDISNYYMTKKLLASSNDDRATIGNNLVADSSSALPSQPNSNIDTSNHSGSAPVPVPSMSSLAFQLHLTARPVVEAPASKEMDAEFSNFLGNSIPSLFADIPVANCVNSSKPKPSSSALRSSDSVSSPPLPLQNFSSDAPFASNPRKRKKSSQMDDKPLKITKLTELGSQGHEPPLVNIDASDDLHSSESTPSSSSGLSDCKTSPPSQGAQYPLPIGISSPRKRNVVSSLQPKRPSKPHFYRDALIDGSRDPVLTSASLAYQLLSTARPKVLEESIYNAKDFEFSNPLEVPILFGDLDVADYLDSSESKPSSSVLRSSNIQGFTPLPDQTVRPNGVLASNRSKNKQSLVQFWNSLIEENSESSKDIDREQAIIDYGRARGRMHSILS